MEALIVIDYQNDFVDGALGFNGAEKLDNGISKLMKEFYNSGKLVIATKDTHYADTYLETEEGKAIPIPHCINGTIGHHLYGRVGDFIATHPIYIINKETFASQKVVDYLKEQKNLKEVNLVGLVTNFCIMANAILIKESLPHIEVKVLEDLCLSYDDNLHKSALKTMEAKGIKVISNF